MNFYDCDFANQTSQLKGGIIYLNGVDTCNVVRSKFKNNSAEYGGAIYGQYITNISFCDCIFENNYAVRDGGAVFLPNTDYCTFLNCSFKDNLAEKRDGGAIVVDCGNNFTMRDCTFNNNVAADRGGSAYLRTNNGVMSNCSIVNDVSKPTGGFKVWGDNWTVYNCSFALNSNDTEFGKYAFSMDGDNNIIFDCIFTNNTAGKTAGLGILGTNDTVLNCIFTDNHAVEGAALYASDVINLKVIGCYFANNTASESGGAACVGNLFFYPWDVEIDCTFYNCSFVNNSASLGIIRANDYYKESEKYRCTVYGCNFTSNNGSAIENAEAVNCIIEDNFEAIMNGHALNCTFRNCEKYMLGIAVNCTFENNNPLDSRYVMSGNAVNSTFINNVGGGLSGNAENCSFIHNAGCAMIGGTALNCIFVDNIGGAMSHDYINYNDAYAINCIFENNTGADYGGALSGSATNCTFINNHAKNGGAVSGSAVGCIFINNSAENSGGAVSGSATNCTFINNHAENGGAVLGSAVGCIFINNSAVDCGGAVSGSARNSIFTNNSARVGGAVYIGRSNYVVANCSFEHNHADEGGAINWQAYDGVVSNSTFVENDANRGGAIYWNSGKGTVENCDFRNNFANDTAGAIYAFMKESIVTNCSFEENSANNLAGAIYWYSFPGEVTVCSFTGNSAKNGGAIYWNDVTGTVSASNFNNNHAQDKGGAVYWNAYDGLIEDSIFENNSANEANDVYCDESFGLRLENNIFANEDENQTGEDEKQIIVSIWNGDDERGKLYTDSEGDVVSVDVSKGIEGTITVAVGDKEFGWDIEGDEENLYHGWTLDDLKITEAGEYDITVKHDGETLKNETINVFEFEDDEFRAEIDYEDETLSLYCPQNAQGTVIIVTKREIDGSEFENVSTLTHTIGDEDIGDWIEWSLRDDLGFENNALHKFELTVQSGGSIVFSYNATHIVEDDEEPIEGIEFNFEDSSSDLESDVVAKLYIPDSDEFAGKIVTVNVTKNGKAFATIKTSDVNIKGYYDSSAKAQVFEIALNLSQVADKDILEFSLDCFEDESWSVSVQKDGDSVRVSEYAEVIEMYVFYGNLTTGDLNDPDLMGPRPNGDFISVGISDSYAIADGTISLTDGDKVILSKALSDCKKQYDYSILGYGYSIGIDEIDFSSVPQNVTLTATFASANYTMSQKRILLADYMYKVITAEDVERLFEISIEDGLSDKNSTALSIIATDDANRQSIYIDVGGGYFTVYVNGIKVENLGRLIPYNEGSELELFRLCTSNEGCSELYLSLENLGIAQSGVYNIKVTHYPSVKGGLDDHSDMDGEDFGVEYIFVSETEIANRNITVSLAEPQLQDISLTVNVSDIDYGGDAVVCISANKVFSGNVLVQVGDGNYTAVLSNGAGNVTVSALDAGSYVAKAVFEGNAAFAADEANATFSVNRIASQIIVSKLTTTYGTSKNLVVTLKDANGRALEGKNVTVVLNKKAYSKITDSNGQISIAVPKNLAVKTYVASITFNGDTNHIKATKSVNVVVSKATPKLTAKAKSFKRTVKTKKYTVTLKTDKNAAIKSTKVTIKVNKKTYTAKTNSKGQATFKITKLTKKGKYTAVVKFAGNSKYKAVTKKPKITVK